MRCEFFVVVYTGTFYVEVERLVFVVEGRKAPRSLLSTTSRVFCKKKMIARDQLLSGVVDD